MAALALQQTRIALPAFKTFWSRPMLSAVLLPAFLASPRPFTWALPSIQSLLELFPPFLLAVPKKKTSHSRKAMRSANKGLKDKHSTFKFIRPVRRSHKCPLLDLVHCPGCGSPKLAHHLCPECYSSVNRSWKAKEKQSGGGEIPSVSMSD